MDKLSQFGEQFGKLPRIVKVAAGLGTLAAAVKINYELNPKPEVTVLNLHGTIVAGRAGLNGQPPINMENLRKKIDFAFKPKRLEYVLLNINSPGGAPVQCDLISSYIKKKSEEKGVPVIAFVEDVAASGGYWLACSASEIYAARSSIVGSIGVIGGGFGFVEVAEKIGVERRVFTAGKCKSQMDPFQPLKEEDVARQQVILNSMHSHFIEHVKNSRGDKLKADDEKLFNGEYWTGDKAAELGLVDGLQLLDAWVTAKYGDEKNVRVFRTKAGGFLESLLGAALEFVPGQKFSGMNVAEARELGDLAVAQASDVGALADGALR